MQSLDKQEGDGEDLRCRICFDEEDCQANPLMLACKCKGATGLVHFNCLKRWVHSQKQSQTRLGGSVKSYYWKWFGCEICKEVYPSTFKIGDNIYKIMDLKDEITS